MSTDALVLLSHLKVENANLISGPLTWGFPAITAFLGFAHNLLRNMPELGCSLNGVGVVCHAFAPQASKPGGMYDYVLHLNRYPADTKKDVQKIEKGSMPSFIEDGRAHMEISLVLGLAFEEYLDEESGPEVAERIMERAARMRVAGGVVTAWKKPCWALCPGAEQDRARIFRKFRRRLLPGFALIDRSDLLRDRGGVYALDELLDLCALHHESVEEDGKTIWKSRRKKPGWLVPIPVGYRALSPVYEAGTVKNARDAETPFRFVESACSMGEWKSPNRIGLPEYMLWNYAYQPEKELYLCTACKPYEESLYEPD